MSKQYENDLGSGGTFVVANANTASTSDYLSGILTIVHSVATHLIFFAYYDGFTHLEVISEDGVPASLSDSGTALRVYWSGTALNIKNGFGTPIALSVGLITGPLYGSTI